MKLLLEYLRYIIESDEKVVRAEIDPLTGVVIYDDEFERAITTPEELTFHVNELISAGVAKIDWDPEPNLKPIRKIYDIRTWAKAVLKVGIIKDPKVFSYMKQLIKPCPKNVEQVIKTYASVFGHHFYQKFQREHNIESLVILTGQSIGKLPLNFMASHKEDDNENHDYEVLKSYAYKILSEPCAGGSTGFKLIWNSVKGELLYRIGYTQKEVVVTIDQVKKMIANKTDSLE